ncbi:hypothetical protein PoB_004843800 [Plakobranchus ocellatus]|uniref:Uncharacterized protein n=1 Tax=Plakobranchus ocellatus TaxID=259542 RepID=A0AAV4BS07_9GAST|nr:hypothetical protein PoB_004843800 [Plakobranchus ocellatus]
MVTKRFTVTVITSGSPNLPPSSPFPPFLCACIPGQKLTSLLAASGPMNKMLTSITPADSSPHHCFLVILSGTRLITHMITDHRMTACTQPASTTTSIAATAATTSTATTTTTTTVTATITTAPVAAVVEVLTEGLGVGAAEGEESTTPEPPVVVV